MFIFSGSSHIIIALKLVTQHVYCLILTLERCIVLYSGAREDGRMRAEIYNRSLFSVVRRGNQFRGPMRLMYHLVHHPTRKLFTVVVPLVVRR